MDKFLPRAIIEDRRQRIMTLALAQIHNPSWPYLAGTENWLPKPDISLEDIELVRVESLMPGGSDREV
jgi:hypothetical protein